jgi:hypothetical protein
MNDTHHAEMGAWAEVALKMQRENAQLRAEVERLKAERAHISTNVRQFDLVRFMRSELHDADLITDDEYAWLCCEADMANSPKGGSPSPRRLEDYDSIKQRAERAEADSALLDFAEAHPEIGLGSSCPNIRIVGFSQCAENGWRTMEFRGETYREALTKAKAALGGRDTNEYPKTRNSFKNTSRIRRKSCGVCTKQ